MADDNGILGASAGISAGSAADAVAERIAEVNAQVGSSQNPAQVGSSQNPARDAYDAGRTSFTTSGTPFLGDRYNGPASIPYSAPQPAQQPVGPAAPAQMFESHQAALDLTRDLTTDLNNDYTRAGRFLEIGGDEYHADRQGILESAGLAAPPPPPDPPSSVLQRLGGAYQNLRNSPSASAYGIGFSAQALGQGVSQLQELNQGQYVTPEQQATAGVNAFLPGTAALVGTALGGPVGGLVAGAAGEAGAAVFGAGEARDQAGREAAERLAAALGQAADTAGAFKSQLEATGAPLAQLGQSLQITGSVGTAGAGTVAGIGALTNAFGERAGEDFGVIARYTSSPLLYGLGNKVAGGLAGSSDFDALGYDAAENGDFAGLKQLQSAASDARVKDNPVYQAAAGRLSKDSNDFLGLGGLGVSATRFLRSRGVRLGTDIDSDLQAEDDQKAAAGADPNAQAQNDLINQFARLRAGDIVAQSGIGVAQVAIERTSAVGGSAAQIGQASQALYSGLGAARAATQGEVSLLQSDLANPVNAGRADELRAKIAQQQAVLGGYEVQEAQQRRTVFETGLGEEGAEFEQTVNRNTLTGRSQASLAGGYRRQEEFLQGVAADPRNPLSPTERAGIQQSADTLRYNAAQQLYGEENAGLAVSRAGREAEVSREAVLGSPQDQYAAAISSLTSDRQQITQNSSEIARGNLTRSQQLGLQAQNTLLAADLTTGPERARVAAYDAEGSILGNQQSADRALLGRNAAISGSAAYAGAFGDDQVRISLYNAAAASSPAGSQQQARFAASAAQAGALLLDDTTQSQVFRETAEQRTQDNNVQSAFRRSLEAPYLDGSPDASPFTRGTAALANLRTRENEAERALNAATDPLAREQDSARVNQYKDQIAGLEQERRTGFLRALPEFIAGSPGQGNLSGVLPTAGQSAFYDGNPFITGTFGRAAAEDVSDGNGRTAQAGGAAGAFLAGSGADAGIAGLTSAINGLRQDLQRSHAAGGRSPAMTGNPAGYSQQAALHLPGNGY